MEHIGIYWNTIMELSLSNTPVLYLRPSYSGSPLSMIQALKLSSIDSRSAGSGFEAKFYGFLVGFHGFGSFKYFGWLFYIDMLMWRYQSEVLVLI